MTVLVIIPARGGSKGVPRKNLAEIAGRPLIAHAITNAKAVRGVDRLIVSTEDEEIAAAARAAGAEVPFLRPADLAADHVSLIPVAIHAMRQMDELDFRADMIATLQPTAPLLGPKRIDQAIAMMRETGCDSVVPLFRIEYGHPYRALTLAEDGRLEALFPEGERFLQRQDRPPFHSMTGGFFLRRRELLENWSGKDFGLGADRRGFVVSAEEAVNIDTPLDLEVARVLLERKLAAHA